MPDPGVSADLHLGSIMTSLSRGYLQSDAVARRREPDGRHPQGAPRRRRPSQGIETVKNADYATFLKSVEAAQAANDPKELAIRVKRPGRLPEFAADANGNLVALVHDFLLEVPAPAQAAQGGLAGPPARVYRISAPEAEFSIAFKVEPQTEKAPIRLTGRIVDFSPGPGAKVFAVNEDEEKAAPLTAFTSALRPEHLRQQAQGPADRRPPEQPPAPRVRDPLGLAARPLGLDSRQPRADLGQPRRRHPAAPGRRAGQPGPRADADADTDGRPPGGPGPRARPPDVAGADGRRPVTRRIGSTRPSRRPRPDPAGPSRFRGHAP